MVGDYLVLEHLRGSQAWVHSNLGLGSDREQHEAPQIFMRGEGN